MTCVKDWVFPGPPVLAMPRRHNGIVTAFFLSRDHIFRDR